MSKVGISPTRQARGPGIYSAICLRFDRFSANNLNVDFKVPELAEGRSLSLPKDGS